ncbi:hypothetical protein AOLI_G00167370 [Acnodon oligacanthus]
MLVSRHLAHEGVKEDICCVKRWQTHLSPDPLWVAADVRDMSWRPAASHELPKDQDVDKLRPNMGQS